MIATTLIREPGSETLDYRCFRNSESFVVEVGRARRESSPSTKRGYNPTATIRNTSDISQIR